MARIKASLLMVVYSSVIISASSTPFPTITNEPTTSPSKFPTNSPTGFPTGSPTKFPTTSPTTKAPTTSPTSFPTSSPTYFPTQSPSISPSASPTQFPSNSPTTSPTKQPSKSPTTSPTKRPTVSPTSTPTSHPTGSPTKRPTVEPTTSPTKAPTKAPTACNTRCPPGLFNVDWESHRENTVCLSPSDLNCDPCPPGTYTPGAPAWEGCKLCGDSEVFCVGGKSSPEKRSSNELDNTKCTYRSDLVGSPSTFVTLEGPAFAGNVLVVNEEDVRDAVADCGSLTFAPEVEVEVVRPAVTFFDFVIENESELPVRVSASSWVLPQYLEIPLSAGVGSFTLLKGEEFRVPFVVKSSSMSDVEFDSAGVGMVTSSFIFIETQVFTNKVVESRIRTVQINVELRPAVLQVLPQENNLEVSEKVTTEQTLTVYNLHPADVRWQITGIEYNSVLTKRNAFGLVQGGDNGERRLRETGVLNLEPKMGLGRQLQYSPEPWLSVFPTSGNLSSPFKCTIDNLVESNFNAKYTEVIQVSTNATGLPPGTHFATINLSNGQRNVPSKITMVVLPGEIVFEKSTWSFTSTTSTLNPFPWKILKLPTANLKIVPRDEFEIETSPENPDEQFKVAWTLLIEVSKDDLNSTAVQDTVMEYINGTWESTEIPSFSFSNEKFEASIDPPKVGLYVIEATSKDGLVHLVNSPEVVFFDQQDCDAQLNYKPTPGTGRSCICITGYGEDQGSCKQCAAGTFGTSNGECEVCPVGTVQSQTGATSCAICPQSSEPNDSQTACQPCKPNEAVDDTKPSRLCSPCRSDQHVVDGVCVCRDAFYTRLDGSCAPCPTGAYCSFAVASTVKAMEGYWRTDWDLLTFVPCVDGGTEACGGVPLEKMTDLTNNLTQIFETRSIWTGNGLPGLEGSANRSWAAFEMQSIQLYEELGVSEGCATGYSGPTCNECSPGFYPQVTDSGSCLSCETFVRTAGILALTLLIGIGALFYFIYRTIKAARHNGRRREIMIFKLVFSHLQVVSMAKEFPLRWPGWLVVVFDAFTVISSAGNSAIDMHCIAYYLDGLSNGYAPVFFQTSLGYALFPFFFCVFSGFFWAYLAPRWRIFMNNRRQRKAESKLLESQQSGLDIVEQDSLPSTHLREGEVMDHPSDSTANFQSPSLPGNIHYRAASCPVPSIDGPGYQGRQRYQKQLSVKENGLLPTTDEVQSTLPPEPSLSNYEKFVVSNLVLLFVVQPWLTRVGLRFFSCSKDIHGKTFLEASFSLECGTSAHREMTWLGYVILMFYGVGIPLLTLFILYCIVLRGGMCSRGSSKRKSKTSAGTDDMSDGTLNQELEEQIERDLATQDKLERLEGCRDTYGFIYNGFRPECFFWETLVMARKTAFALIVVALKPIGVDVQTYAGLCVLMIAGALQLTYRPYHDSLNMNEVESTSLAITFATLMCGVFLFSDNTAGWFKITCSILVLILNMGFLFSVAYTLRHEVKESAQNVVKEIRATILTAGRMYNVRRKSSKLKQSEFGSDRTIQSADVLAIEDDDTKRVRKVPVNAPHPRNSLPGHHLPVRPSSNSVNTASTCGSSADGRPPTPPPSPYRSPKAFRNSANRQSPIVPALNVGTFSDAAAPPPPPLPPRSPAALSHSTVVKTDSQQDTPEVEASNVRVVPSAQEEEAVRSGRQQGSVAHSALAVEADRHLVPRGGKHERNSRDTEGNPQSRGRARTNSRASHNSHGSSVMSNAELLQVVGKFRQEAVLEQQANHPRNAANIALETLKALEMRMQEEVSAEQEHEESSDEEVALVYQ